MESAMSVELNKYQKKIIFLFLVLFLLGCRMPEYYDREQRCIELGYERSVVEIQGFVEVGVSSYHLYYRFNVADSIVRQERYMGYNVNTDLLRFYAGSRFEILYNPKHPEMHLILYNKPVFEKNIRFGKTNGRIEGIFGLRGGGRGQRSFLSSGFLKITCRYWVNGKDYIHRGGISKDLFFPNKDYNEITRKDLKQLRRKYKGKTCTIEYDVNNPGISRLVEASVVENVE